VGEWVDAFTGEAVFPGVVERSTPIDELPAYVKASAWPALSRIFAAE
jgi:hypothetical protein